MAIFQADSPFLCSCLLLLSFFIGAAGCQIADIRPAEVIRKGISTEDRIRGRHLLERVVFAYELSRKKTEKLHRQKMTVIFRERWHAWLPALFNKPFPEESDVELSFVRDEPGIQFRIRKGPWLSLQGRWNGKTLSLSNRSSVKVQESLLSKRRLSFHARAKRFFFELPFNLRNFRVVAKMGDTTIEGRRYHRLFLSNTLAPDPDQDQFIAYLDPRSFRLDILHYTIRELGGRFTGAISFSDFRNVDGILFPFTGKIHWTPGGKEIVHEYRIRSVKFENPA
ncbi:MAG: hypothetical protein D6679_04980 [Candidatus Hydrogenedentota bacterium]|nr:MAG: hypothetical protein D6679_04980 [Candidatus Hydrogenedentota bacterium]